MKKTYIFILIVSTIIVVIASYLVRQESTEEIILEKTHKPVTKPNVVSQAEKKLPTSGFDQDKWQKKHDEKMAMHEQLWLAFLADRDVKAMNLKPTYLEAYRDYVYYDGCTAIISNILNDQDPYFYVLRRNQSFEDLPVAQQQVLNERLNKCLRLTDFSDKTYHPQYALTQLMQRYKAIPPKTDKEQQLAATLKLLEDLNFNKNRLSSVQRGEINDHQLHIDLISLRRELQKQMPKPATLLGGYSESDQILVNQLRSQIAEIDQQISDNKQIDTEKAAGFKAEINRLISELQRVVIDTQSSDAYLVVYELIEDQTSEDNMQSLEAQFTGGIQLIPREYEAYLMPILVHFRACELLHPCGQDSLLVEQQCLNFTNEKAPKACNSGLIDYYLNNYLSPNQLFDVEYILTEGY